MLEVHPVGLPAMKVKRFTMCNGSTEHNTALLRPVVTCDQQYIDGCSLLSLCATHEYVLYNCFSECHHTRPSVIL